MFYLIDTKRRRVIGWWGTLNKLKVFIKEYKIELSEHVKIVKDLK